MKSKTWTAAVIGLGQIGMGYDYEQPPDSAITSHCQALQCCDRISLIAGVDPDIAARKAFERKFSGPTYPSIEALFGAMRPDIVVVATPSQRHHQNVLSAITHRPVAILCEKPLATTVAQGFEMVAAAKDAGVPLFINYVRRFEPGLLQVKHILESKRIGVVRKGLVWYGKGIANNASHFIDALRFLLGEVTDISARSNQAVYDGPTGDLNADFTLSFGESAIHFLCADHRQFTVAECDLIADSGRIQYLEGGAKIGLWTVRDDPEFAGYKILSSQPEAIPSATAFTQRHVLDHIVRFLDGHVSDGLSTGETALKTLEVVESVLDLIRLQRR